MNVSQIGTRKHIYWNTDFLGHFGGTYDVLTGIYLRSTLDTFGATAQIRNPGVATRKKLLRALEEGNLIYLQLFRNRIYGSHHLLCYGYTTLREIRSGKEVVYLILADGWGAAPRYLALSELGLFHYYAIQ